jgi:hypothetical protein
MNYKLYIPDNDKKEFKITPKEARIAPLSSIPIQVYFTPAVIDTYEKEMLIDVESVGTELFNVAIKAQSLVPEV